jgi:beta-lactamase class A
MINFFTDKLKIKRGVGILVLVGALIFGYLIGQYKQSKQNVFSNNAPLRVNSPDLKYINPLLICENAVNKSEFKEYKSLETKLNNFIIEAKKTTGLTDMGVYYRDLVDSKWTGVNEDESFSPGSLQKVPLMIAYYKLQEIDNQILEKKLVNDIPNDVNLIQTVKPEKFISYGQSATIFDLIKLMIIYSDNNAADVLFNNIDHQLLKEVFADLGINFNKDVTHSDFISAKQFSLFFRILYNSTYLTWYNSEQSLAVLAQSDFKDGIVAGVPNNIKVAHKFGEGYDESEPVTLGKHPEQLHDCGIVYYPSHPYLLCVMTKGKVGKIKDLEQGIQKVSQIVYQDVESRYH